MASSDRQESISRLQSLEENRFVIPLMSKRMNSVEKYISQLSHNPSDFITKNRKEKAEFQSPNNNAQQKVNLHHYRSTQISPLSVNNSKITLSSDRCCIQYDSISSKRGVQRIQTLSQLEKDYSLLKNKMQSERISPFKLPILAKKTNNHNSSQQIAKQDVQKQIKNTMINQNGKQYFADLYLLKKGRQEIINSLSEAGKTILQQHKGKSYEQRNQESNHEFIKHKIFEDRQIKKNKMLKGRNLHWNVYYDMLALSSNEKKKLNSLCKFNSTFGIT